MNEALAEAWLQELWPTCREVSREERAVERARHAVDTPSNTRAKSVLTCENGRSPEGAVNTPGPLDPPARTTGRRARGEHYAPGP